MQPETRREVEAIVERATGRPGRVEDTTSVGGGSINAAYRVRLSDGRDVFVKTNTSLEPAIFEREAEGLTALADVDAMRVPRPLGTGRDTPMLVMEFIRTGRRPAGFSERLGRELAELHRQGRNPRAGFDHDNVIGSTPQPNPWTDDWIEFWRRHRLGFQLELAREHGRSTGELDRLGEKMMARLDELLQVDDDASMSLLHGDLWGGNYLVAEDGAPVLIDPAAYYGHREAELGMTTLFGGFDARFYAAYNETWPLADGWRDRLEIYGLYHLLNHLNLFGRSYLSGCLRVLRRFT